MGGRRPAQPQCAARVPPASRAPRRRALAARLGDHADRAHTEVVNRAFLSAAPRAADGGVGHARPGACADRATAGAAFRPHPNVIVKADRQWRSTAPGRDDPLPLGSDAHHARLGGLRAWPWRSTRIWWRRHCRDDSRDGGESVGLVGDQAATTGACRSTWILSSASWSSRRKRPLFTAITGSWSSPAPTRSGQESLSSLPARSRAHLTSF